MVKSLNPCDRKSYVGTEESPHLSVRIPVSVQEETRIRAVGSPHPCGRTLSHVKQEAVIGASEILLGPEGSPGVIWP